MQLTSELPYAITKGDGQANRIGQNSFGFQVSGFRAEEMGLAF